MLPYMASSAREVTHVGWRAALIQVGANIKGTAFARCTRPLYVTRYWDPSVVEGLSIHWQESSGRCNVIYFVLILNFWFGLRFGLFPLWRRRSWGPSSGGRGHCRHLGASISASFLVLICVIRIGEIKWRSDFGSAIQEGKWVLCEGCPLAEEGSEQCEQLPAVDPCHCYRHVLKAFKLQTCRLGFQLCCKPKQSQCLQRQEINQGKSFYKVSQTS